LNNLNKLNKTNTNSDEDLSTAKVEQILDQVYRWSKARNYRGYNKHDGLNSPIVRLFMGWTKWTRIIAIQSVMRFPVNIRPYILVRKSANPKGLALFAQGLLHRYLDKKDPKLLAEAEKILAKLYKLKSPGQWAGDCWGYHYPWQDLGFYARSKTPNAVVSCFVCEAYLDAYEITHKTEYLDVVRKTIDFFLNDLVRLKDTEDELCLSYMPLQMTMRVMDVSILIGAVIARFSQFVQNDAYLVYSTRLVRYVKNQQSKEGAWYYTDPPEDSPVKIDNYHTGFILDALYRYMQSTDHWDWKNQYDLGLSFYANNLFNEDGSPRWMSHRNYPHDIHGAAQGIITFSRHLPEYGTLVKKIIKWSIENMYNEKGRFYYQARRSRIKKFTLMRWCNAWMARALSEWLIRQTD